MAVGLIQRIRLFVEVVQGGPSCFFQGKSQAALPALESLAGPPLEVLRCIFLNVTLDAPLPAPTHSTEEPPSLLLERFGLWDLKGGARTLLPLWPPDRIGKEGASSGAIRL